MDENRRFKLAIWTLGIGILMMFLLAILMIIAHNYEDAKRSFAATKAFDALIPLIATWIGAIIAFYFGRENFEAAQKQIQKILDKDTLDNIEVKNVMINLNTMVFKKPVVVTTPLSEYGEFLKTIDKTRLPLLNENGSPQYILHKSTIDNALTEKPQGTLQDLLTNNAGRFGFNQPKGFVTVPQTLTLEEATKRMKNLENCHDIFVTDDGEGSGKVVGWITDSLITSFLDLKNP